MTTRIDVIGQNGNDGAHYDPVNRPEHYQTQQGLECIDVIRVVLGAAGFQAYCRGNVLKYLWRTEKKGGIEDLRKAQWYLNKMVEEAAP